jgi:lipoprotein-releasing system permease protein
LITLVAPEGDVTPLGTTPRVKAYPVVAIYEVGMSELTPIVFMPLPRSSFQQGLQQSIEVRRHRRGR